MVNWQLGLMVKLEARVVVELIVANFLARKVAAMAAPHFSMYQSNAIFAHAIFLRSWYTHW